MRTSKLMIAAVLAAATLSANAARPQTEGPNSPFTYEAVGATPSLTFSRASTAAPAAAEAPKAAVAKPTATRTETPRTAGVSGTPFTYDAVGATPHVETGKPAKTEVLAHPAR